MEEISVSGFCWVGDMHRVLAILSKYTSTRRPILEYKEKHPLNGASGYFFAMTGSFTIEEIWALHKFHNEVATHPSFVIDDKYIGNMESLTKHILDREKDKMESLSKGILEREEF